MSTPRKRANRIWHCGKLGRKRLPKRTIAARRICPPWRSPRRSRARPRSRSTGPESLPVSRARSRIRYTSSRSISRRAVPSASWFSQRRLLCARSSRRRSYFSCGIFRVVVAIRSYARPSKVNGTMSDRPSTWRASTSCAEGNGTRSVLIGAGGSKLCIIWATSRSVLSDTS